MSTQSWALTTPSCDPYRWRDRRDLLDAATTVFTWYTAVKVPDGEIATDFQFTVTDVRPTVGAPERVGTTLTLRVPGGCLPGGMCGGAEDAPQVAAGDDLFVFDQDQGSLLGGNTTTRLVASTSANVFTVRGNVVY